MILAFDTPFTFGCGKDEGGEGRARFADDGGGLLSWGRFVELEAERGCGEDADEGYENGFVEELGLVAELGR